MNATCVLSLRGGTPKQSFLHKCLTFAHVKGKVASSFLLLMTTVLDYCYFNA